MKEKSKKLDFCFPVYDEISEEISDITAIYLRVSTDMQAQDGYGLDFQFDAIKKYVQAYDIKNPVVFVDDGYTGMNEDRPAFRELNRLMENGRVKFVITYSLDRIGRTQMLILKFLKERCDKFGCDFYAVKDNIDSRSRQTYGILISILSIFAEFDHDAIVAKLSQGRYQRALDGLWKGGGIAPVGYKYSKETNTLEVVPEEAVRVQKAFEMYNTREYSPRLIAETLGFKSDILVFNILKNRTYIGEITFQGKQFKGIHQRIIDDATFIKAQQILQERAVTKQSSRFLLSSLVYCGVCGAKMRYMKWGKGKNIGGMGAADEGGALISGGGKNNDGANGEISGDNCGSNGGRDVRKAQYKLVCYSKYNAKDKPYIANINADCDNETYDADVVEAYVSGAILEFAVRYSDEMKNRCVRTKDIAEQLTEEYERLEERYRRAVKTYTMFGDESILEQAQAFQTDMKRISREIDTAREKARISAGLEERINLLRTLPDTWREMSAKQRQNVMRELVQKVVITHGHIDVYLYDNKFDTVTVVEEK